MQNEYEVKFSDVNHHKLKKLIQQIGGEILQEKTLMKRIVFKKTWCKLEKAYFRVRDEGNKITCTYKSLTDDINTIHSVQEVETIVDDFDAMKEILLLTGLEQIAYQESYRETWTIAGTEIYFMLDEWPGIKPFIEIEWASEELVKEYSKKLKFDYSTWIFWAVDELFFQELHISHNEINSLKEITFQNPPKRQ